ncbi:hypothetical protein [Roseateles sp. PN1]|uniref:hypothetical protein n=1 Tax=Roseateles sp. PN1 TaxID=3137372 RepID=UPI00313A00C3
MKLILPVIIVATLILSGCEIKSSAEIAQQEEKIATLQKENLELRQWAAQFEEKALKQAEQEKAVLLATSCDFLVPICPSALSKPGRELLTAGVLPNEKKLHYWLVGKAIAVIVFPLMGLLLGYFGWLLWGGRAWREVGLARAERDQAKNEATATILDATQQALNIIDRATTQEKDHIKRAEAELAELEWRIKDAQARLQTRNEDLQSIQEQIIDADQTLHAVQVAVDEARKNLEMHQAARKALGGF